MRIVTPITINDSNFVSSTVAENDYPVYSSSTNYTLNQYVIINTGGVHKVYQSLRGGSSVVTLTNASPIVVGWVANGLANGTAVTFTTTGTLPGNLSANTTYYVVNAGTDTFNVSATYGGTPINASSAGSGTHTCYDTPNLNHPPATSPSYWLDCGATNRWRMFDQSVQSQTTATTYFSFTISTSSYVDTIALLNLVGISARVQITASGNTVYDKTVALSAPKTPVTDLYTYFFTGFRATRDVIFDGIPPYAVTQITVTVTAASGQTAACGAAIFGLSTDISSTGKGVEWGAKTGIDDYSIKTRDDFGNYTILERAYNKRADFTVYIDTSDVDYVQNLLTDRRALPTLYIGSRQSNLRSTAIFGFYKSFDVEISYVDVSVCTISLAGLT